MTEIIRSDPPDENTWALISVLIITLFVFVLTGVTVFWIIITDVPFFPIALGPVTAQLSIPALWIGFIFIGMAAALDLYRKHFVPDEMVAKVRLEKVVPRREFK